MAKISKELEAQLKRHREAKRLKEVERQRREREKPRKKHPPRPKRDPEPLLAGFVPAVKPRLRGGLE